MGSHTINDSMADVRYEFDDRFIYNDVRSSIGVTNTQTVVDSDPTYEWRSWQEYHGLPVPGETTFRYFTATIASPLAWRIRDVTCYDYDLVSYSGFQIDLVDTNDANTKAAKLTNTGSSGGTIRYTVEYKCLATDAVTHEESTYSTLVVRATDDDSIAMYGRRTMNLVWPTGATEPQMQSIVNRYLAKHKDPVARAYVTLKGEDDTARATIYSAEISDSVTLVCTRLGINDAFWLDAIAIRGSFDGIPVATWLLTDKDAVSEASIFILDTSELDGSDLLG